MSFQKLNKQQVDAQKCQYISIEYFYRQKDAHLFELE